MNGRQLTDDLQVRGHPIMSSGSLKAKASRWLAAVLVASAPLAAHAFPLSIGAEKTLTVMEDPAFTGDALFAEDGADIDYPRIAQVTKRQAADTIDPNDPTTWGRVSRNTACPCNSGRKYKHCHGKIV